MIHNFALSIAGLDPSAGAGLLADIKTFEQLGVYGLGVCSAVTAQNEDTFGGIQWTSLELIFQQIDLLFAKYSIQFCKIGIMPDWEFLDKIIDHLLEHNQELKITVDPIFRASSGFDFMPKKLDSVLQENILKKIYLLTPNATELKLMNEDNISIEDYAKQLSQYCAILLKGGHRKDSKQLGIDDLYQNGKVNQFIPKRTDLATKHGSGCVLSAAITAYLAQGKPLVEACQLGKIYISNFLNSHPSLLGIHKI